MAGEFEIIARYFTGIGSRTGNVALGVGDDCALFDVPPGAQLAVTTDTLVAGVHFPSHFNPSLLARRALRVNLSDLAAMGALPLGFQLALTLPDDDETWLMAFSAGLAEDASLYRCPLTGGDTTRGPLSITITAVGSLPSGEALTRDGAAAGDLVYITGSLGDGRGALAVLEAGPDKFPKDLSEYLLQRYWLPVPRLSAGAALRTIASAAIDVSDGLVQDLGHIARRSDLGAEIEIGRLPLSGELLRFAGSRDAARWALTGGDDYELCITVPPAQAPAAEKALSQLAVPFTRIGVMIAGTGVRCRDSEGKLADLGGLGYDHFRQP